MNRRVVVTGLGLVTPVGNSLESTWVALAAAKSGADYIRKFDAEKFPVRFACEVKDFDPTRLSWSERLHRVIPGGAHTYSRGDDQYPSNAPPILARPTARLSAE